VSPPLAERAQAPSPRRDGLAVLAVALVARLAMIAWASGRIPPAADGVFYHQVATRIAEGLGYTWLWPDGAVTYAAHYPVGYPALVGGAYALAGPRPVVAMLLNAALGALAALAAHALAARCTTRRRAVVAGMLVALHPGLVAYTPALMTEGVTGALVIGAAAVAAWARTRGPAAAILVGVVVGVATLVRPQSLVLAPAFGLLAGLAPGRVAVRRVASTTLAATLAALLVCAPWTARNCVHMKRCALVSVNGGWNLLIGADAASTGAWSPVKVPDACREVFDEAQKDVCFGDAARAWIADHPAEWLALAPKKLAATFDYAGAAPWYLHEANGAAFPWPAKEALGAAETLYERVALLLALVWAARPASLREGTARGRAMSWSRVAIAVAGAVFVFMRHGWVAYVALGVAALLRGRRLWEGPVLPAATVVTLLATAATHAVFFGAGRYGLVVFPLVTTLSALALGRPAEPELTS
jgi:4-amino-4-deoxy-L-arabinose transferase-like glycosyltransferase